MFSKKNIQDISIEETSHASGSRQMLVAKDETSSKYFEAHTYGYLPSGVKWDMHEHDNVVEICVVIKGAGIVRDIDGNQEAFGLEIGLFSRQTQSTRSKTIQVKMQNSTSFDSKINKNSP